MHQECCQPVRASVVTAHNIVKTSSHMSVPHPHQPCPSLVIQCCQSLSEVVETPGSGEVETIKMNQFTISSVNHLDIVIIEISDDSMGLPLPAPGQSQDPGVEEEIHGSTEWRPHHHQQLWSSDPPPEDTETGNHSHLVHTLEDSFYNRGKSVQLSCNSFILVLNVEHWWVVFDQINKTSFFITESFGSII